MNKMYFFSLIILVFACSDGNDKDVYFDGRLETDVIKISAKTSGNLDSIFVDEGNVIEKGQLLAIVNTDRLILQKQQQQAQLGEINANNASLDAQLKQINSQLKLNEDLIIKTKDLLQKGAATSQKLDEISTQNDILLAQLEGIKAQKSALQNKREQLHAAIALTDLNINDSRLIAPQKGTVLNRFFNPSELVNPGVAVFEIADLTNMDATIYVSLTRLTDIKLNQTVQVLVDGVTDSITGTVQWISSNAEFTPKTILTEETRASLVFAVKVRIKNEQGKLKIGMPVQVRIRME